ncbi:MAG: large conductance mechanosensitive channel protein MscL [Cystobacterineae bacterium]|nr:large conductance mechanosensitive channel protein MscL [Cystobacterineae bacterium]
MLKEFQTFIARGNAIEMAVGIVVGAAFSKIVNSLVSDIIMPPMGLLLGKIDFKSWFIALNGQSYANLEAAKAANAPTLNVGIFLNTAVEFFIIAFCIFIVVKAFNKFAAKAQAATQSLLAASKTDKPAEKAADKAADKLK